MNADQPAMDSAPVSKWKPVKDYTIRTAGFAEHLPPEADYAVQVAHEVEGTLRDSHTWVRHEPEHYVIPSRASAHR
ncbi:MAG TPA: hypothetical protein VMH22_08970 [bacterium]|nr:hypothetical protein [bacterium]